ncbi:MAG: ribosome maturation factor RimP [Acidobacteria bacterium]|nr:ribosome maturation factor RimP [Acidobacteriota bacterium]
MTLLSAPCYHWSKLLAGNTKGGSLAHFFFLRGVFSDVKAEQAQRDRIRTVAERVARSYGLDIFDVQFRRESHGWVLRVIIDRPDPGPAAQAGDAALDPSGDSIGIAECQQVSQDLSAILDVEEEALGLSLPDNYTLEVSSPGLDRPLRHPADYRRFTGRLAKIVSREPIGGQSAFAGRIEALESGPDGETVLLVEGRRTHRIPLVKVSRANLDVEF